MNPNTIILGAMCGLAAAGVGFGIYQFSKFTVEDFRAKMKEENRETGRDLAQ